MACLTAREVWLLLKKKPISYSVSIARVDVTSSVATVICSLEIMALVFPQRTSSVPFRACYRYMLKTVSDSHLQHPHSACIVGSDILYSKSLRLTSLFTETRPGDTTEHRTRLGNINIKHDACLLCSLFACIMNTIALT